MTERTEALVQFVSEEIAAFKEGQIKRLSSNRELQERFQYARVASFYPMLNKRGLLEERRRLFSETGGINSIPSSDLAWMLGVLSGGGLVAKNRIAIFSAEEELISKYQYLGERLFETNMNKSVLKKTADNREYFSADFFSAKNARMLGDLARISWPQTIAFKHGWIFQSQDYIWKLLEGLYEMRGFYDGSGKSIIYSYYNQNSNHFISDLLTRIGVNKPVILQSKQRAEGVKGVGILNIADAKYFANHINSVIPKKEQQLEIVRQRAQLITQSRATSDAEVIAEWIKLRERFGHTPRSNEIQDLRIGGQTKFSTTVYINRFGEGKFSRARDYLERLVSE